MIYLLRHGQTVYNATGRVQGQMDSPLTPMGCAQAEALGRRLAQLIGTRHFALYVSPLGRTLATAAIITRHLPPAALTVHDPRLMEVGMGLWDGMTDFEIESENPGARAGLGVGEWYYHGPEGESYAQVRERLAAAMHDVAAADFPVKIVVSHGAVGRVIRGAHAGLNRAQTLTLDAPQDAFFGLSAGGIVERIDCLA